MNKYALAASHGFASLRGWLKLYSKQPAFARAILRKRWRYFLRREFEPGFVTPDSFGLDTPDALIAYWSMFVEQELHDSEWVEALHNAAQPLVVDVGANAGLFSHLAFTVNPRAEIVAFEPLPAMVTRIEALKRRNRMNLNVIPKAAGRAIGEANLESSHGYDGDSHISQSGHPTGQSIRVDVTTLDHELADTDVLVMKIDVEGFEEEVLAGAKETLLRTRFLIIEAHDAKRRDHLTRLIGSGWRRRKLGASDYLFSRR